MPESYTRITIEIFCSGDKNAHKVIVETNKWDCNIGDMVELFEGAIKAIGFSEKTIDDYYNGEKHA